MSWIAFLVVGLIAGVIAKAVMPGTREEPSGWILTILLGVAGAYVGGFIANALGFGANGNMLWAILMSAVGAMVIIGVLRLLTGSRRAI